MSEEKIPIDRSALRKNLEILQEPLQLIPEPYAIYAEKLGVPQEAVFELLCDYLTNGIVRRVAGVLKHNKAGFTVNAMVAMMVPAEQCDSAGESLARFTFITHCYRRTAYPDWPYTLYAMVHARDEDEMQQHVEKMKDAVPGVTFTVLKSIKEYKKTAFRI